MAVFPREGSLLVLISLSCAWMGFAQAPPSTTVEVPLNVDSGVPLRLYIDQRLHMREGEMVRAKLIDPVYAFDRIVIPSGVDVQGHVTRLDPAPKMVRTQAILGGDFTPLHWARVEFTTIVMPDGRTIPIHTADSEGLRTLYVRPKPSSKKTAGSPQSNSGVLGTACQQAAQEIQAIKAKKTRSGGSRPRAQQEGMAGRLSYKETAVSSTVVPSKHSFRCGLRRPVDVWKGRSAADGSAECRRADH